jgi:YesN/AraC family two-component response regulator
MHTVLYVDDEIINLDLFEISFMNEFQILKAESGEDALEILQKETVDVVVTDLKMPGMDGIELIKKIKESNQQLNCILLTGYYEEHIIRDSDLSSLIFKYLMKPYGREDIIKTILEAAG